MSTPAERFRIKFQVNPASGCWEWQGATNEHGYGLFWLRGRCRKAHRASLELLAGEVLSRSEVVLHRCDNRLCVRPDHLERGNQARNCWDRASKGRHHLQRDPNGQPRDERGRFCTLSEESTT